MKIEDNILIKVYDKDVKSGRFTVPDGVRAIENRAFMGVSKKITEVVLPDSLFEIRMGAFAYMTELRKVTIQKDLRIIGPYAFAGCTNLKELKGKGQAAIQLGSYAFKDCINLKTCEIEPRVIPNGAFYNCSSLKWSIPKNTTEIGTEAFYCTAIDRVCISRKSNLRSIGPNAFRGCTKMKIVSLDPSELLYVGNEAFSNCTKVTDVILNSRVRLGEITFLGCRSLSSVDMGGTDLSVPYGTFTDCKRLYEVTGVEKIRRIDGYAFYGTQVQPSNFDPSVKFDSTSFESLNVRGITKREKALVTSSS